MAHGILGIALALPLLAYASVGWYARYVADDYCWAGVLRTHGFLEAQVYWYTIYSPRYAFTFLVNLVELAGPALRRGHLGADRRRDPAAAQREARPRPAAGTGLMGAGLMRVLSVPMRTRFRGITVEEGSRVFERFTRRLAVESLAPSTLIFGATLYIGDTQTYSAEFPPDGTPPLPPVGPRRLGAALGVVLIVELVWALRRLPDTTFSEDPRTVERVSSIRDVGIVLFTDHVVAFIVMALLVLVAMVGAVVLAARRV